MPKAQETVIEIDLAALEHNLKFLKSKLHKQTKFLAVVKASGYGSDASIVAKCLEQLDVDYFAVAYTAEGIALRDAGIETPILVLHPQKNNLEQKLIRYSDSTSTQIVIAIISRTEGEDVGFLAANWAQKWGIGQKGKDNGIVFLIAKDDRKMTIQAGYGTEHLLTDALSRRIIEVVVKPEFKDGKYFEGIDEGTTAIIKVMNGEYKNDKKKI